MSIEYSAITEKGSRNANEDSIGHFVSKEKQCFVVCDGLGGHGMGDVASKLVVDEFGSLFEHADDISSFLGKAFESAQTQLMIAQKEQKATRKMKTTCVALATDESNAYVGHVGDSRLYVFQKNKVKTRTLDHSIPQMLVLSKDIKESEIRNHPERNYVLRVMGIEWEKPMYELMPTIKLRKCQAFLLCTDGFWELILEEDMCRLLKESDSPEEWLNKMAEIVKHNGEGKNMDNYSAIAVWNTK